MLKSILVVIAALSIMFSANIFSKEKVNGKQSEVYKSISDKEKAEKNKEIKKSEPTAVKYIWKDMPSYDRYGNEITPRARENMMENSLNQKKDSKETNNDITEGKRVK